MTIRRSASLLLATFAILFVHGTADAKAAVKKAAPKAATSVQTCLIKGNISAKNEKIYHMQGCPNYKQTVIDTAAGERMFCTEAEAKNAGWRKSLNCPK